jgi:hypothetical protein
MSGGGLEKHVSIGVLMNSSYSNNPSLGLMNVDGVQAL